MANDDDYDFSGVSRPGPFDVESSVLSQWRAQNGEDEDDDYSYFWPEQLPYDLEEKLREINKVHQEDETPIESDRPRKIAFNSRVQMRAISMRRIPPPAERNDDDERFDLSKYDTDETVDDVVTSITTPREAAKAPAEPPASAAQPLPVSRASSSRGPAAGPAGHQGPRIVNKTAVSRVGQGAPKSPAGVSTSGFNANGGSADPARRGFRDCQNFQLADGVSCDRLSVLSLTDDGDDDACAVCPRGSDTGYSSGGPPPAAATAAPTPKPGSVPTVQTKTSPAMTASKAAAVSVPAPRPLPVVATSAPKLITAETSAPASTSKLVSTAVQVSKSVLSSVPVAKPASVPVSVSVGTPRSVSEAEPVPVSASVSTPAAKLLPASAQAPQSVERGLDRAPPPLSAPTHCSETQSGDGIDVDDLPETISKIWPQITSSHEGYRPSWSETLHQATMTSKTGTAKAVHNQVSDQQTDSHWKLSDSTEPNGRECVKTARSCGCQRETGELLCRCKGDSTIPSCSDSGISKEQLSSNKSEDSAVESMDDHTSCNTAESGSDGSVGAEPTPSAPHQSYAAIHLARLSSSAQTQARRHHLVTTKSSSAGGARPRLSRSSSIGRPPEGRRPVSGGGAGSAGQPRRPRTAAGAERRPSSPAKQPAAGARPSGAADRPRSAPVRSAVSTPTLPHRQPSTQRAGQPAVGAAAGASPPARRRRARSQDPSLTFQQWLQQHERERAQAVQHNKNNAHRRKQEANIKQEKAPQAFRVWLRKKRQQQLMEQRVQQLRQHELLATAAAPPCRQQPDVFRPPPQTATPTYSTSTDHMSPVVRAAGQPTCPAAEMRLQRPARVVASPPSWAAVAAAVLASSTASHRGGAAGSSALNRSREHAPCVLCCLAQHGTMSAAGPGLERGGGDFNFLLQRD